MTNKNIGTVLGISGPAGVGKDTAFAYLSRFLQERFGETLLRVSLADNIRHDLRETVSSLFGEAASRSLQGFGGREMKDKLRPFVVAYAETCKDIYGKDYWCRRAKGQIESVVSRGHVAAITDIRYPEDGETALIKRYNGKLIHLERKGCNPINQLEERNLPKLRESADLVLDVPNLQKKEDLTAYWADVSLSIFSLLNNRNRNSCPLF